MFARVRAGLVPLRRWRPGGPRRPSRRSGVLAMLPTPAMFAVLPMLAVLGPLRAAALLAIPPLVAVSPGFVAAAVAPRGGTALGALSIAPRRRRGIPARGGLAGGGIGHDRDDAHPCLHDPVEEAAGGCRHGP